MNLPMVGIIGAGNVGTHMQRIFPWAIIYDKYKDEYVNNRGRINESAKISFVCVPTPMDQKGSCDISAVEEVISWVESGIVVIKSTVAIGTTDRLIAKTGKNICFSPEFVGTTPHSKIKEDFVILGGTRQITKQVTQLYQHRFSGSLKIRETEARTAELVKYMENAFLATKVVFCNEFYRIAKHFGISYTELRELFLLDPRINPSHTFVFEDQSYYDSSCLNKDLPALLNCAKEVGYNAQFIEAVIRINERFRQNQDDFIGYQELVKADVLDN